jgi:hypothetical protein
LSLSATRWADPPPTRQLPILRKIHSPIRASPPTSAHRQTGLRVAIVGLADVERDLIRTRTAEGRSRAQQRWQRMGRKPKLTEEQQAEARRRAAGATLAELARSYDVGKSTISRLTA